MPYTRKDANGKRVWETTDDMLFKSYHYSLEVDEDIFRIMVDDLMVEELGFDLLYKEDGSYVYGLGESSVQGMPARVVIRVYRKGGWVGQNCKGDMVFITLDTLLDGIRDLWKEGE